MTRLHSVAFALVLAASACSKSDPKDSAPKPTEAEPPKTEPKKEPAKTEPTKAEPTPEPAKTAPAKPVAKKASAADKQRVLDAAGVDKDVKKLSWKSPDGQVVKLALDTHLKGNTYVTDLLIDGKVKKTYDSGVEKDDIHYEAHATLKADPADGGVLIVTSTIKVTGKPANSYHGEVWIWDSSPKELSLGREIEVSEEYDPATEDVKVDD